jgi:lipopolysaccharide export system permease protein
MLFPLTLSFYLIKKFFKDFFLCLGLFTATIQVFTVIDVLRKRDINEATIAPILKLFLLKTPYIADTIMPYMLVLSVIYTLNQLSRTNELVIFKSVGISIWQIIAPVILSFFIFAIIYVGILNPFIALTYKGYNRYKTLLGGTDESIMEVSANGIWLKDKTDHNIDSYIHARKILEKGKSLSGVHVYLHNLITNESRIIRAPKIIMQEEQLIALDATVYRPNAEPEFVKSMTLRSKFKQTDAMEIIPLRSVSVWEYYKTIQKLSDVGFSILKYKYHFYKALCLPIFIVSIVIFALAIGVATFTKTHLHIKLAFGLGSALVLYFISNLIGALTELGTIPMHIAVILPPLIFAAAGLAMILHLEDG